MKIPLLSNFIDFLRASLCAPKAKRIVFLERIKFEKGIPKVAELVESREIFYTIKDPVGHLIHTVLSIDAEGSIDEFLQTERAMNVLTNAGRAERGERVGPTPSWEQFEAEGYSCVPVHLIEAEKILLDGKKDKV